MIHRGTEEIKTQRLTLRRFEVSDAQAMFDNWASDPEVTRFLTWQPYSSADDAVKTLTEWCGCYQKPDFYNWAIEYAGEVVGNISVVRHDDRSELAELGYCIGSKFWGHGIMTEAAGAVIAFLFEQVGVNRVSIEHAVKNPASGRVAQKCGLKYEGTKREYFKTTSGEFLDIAEYSILKREY